MDAVNGMRKLVWLLIISIIVLLGVVVWIGSLIAGLVAMAGTVWGWSTELITVAQVVALLIYGTVVFSLREITTALLKKRKNS